MTSLRKTVALWWLASVVGAFATASPLAPWLEVLRTTPFASAARDVGLLFDRLFTGATHAHVLPAAAMFQATLWQLLVWRCLLLLPMAFTMQAVTQPRGAAHVGKGTAARGITRTLARLPQFFALTIAVQTLVWVGGVFGLGAAASRLTVPEPNAVDITLGAALVGTSLLLFGAGLTVLDTARLCLWRRSTRPLRSDAMSGLIDGIEVLRRRGLALVATVVWYWCLGVFVCLVFSTASLWLAALWSSSWANAVSWSLAQVGIVGALICRVRAWQRVWRWVNEERRPDGALTSQFARGHFQ